MLLLRCFCFGQNDWSDNHFLAFTTVDGLPGNFIYGTTLDRDGFLWIATNRGLARYDGQRFVEFRNLVNDTDLPRSAITAVFADSRGFLWLRFKDDALYSIDPRTYRVTHHQDRSFKQQDVFSPDFTEDKAGNLWFSVTDGLVRWEYSARRFTHYPFPDYDKTIVVRICRGGGDNYLWVASMAGIYRFDLQSHAFTREQALIGHDEKARTLYTDDQGYLWFSNWYNPNLGIACYDPQSRKLVRTYNTHSSPAIVNTDLLHIQGIAGRIWFATNTGGVLVLDPQSEHFQAFRPDFDNPFSIQSEQIYSFQRDKIGNVWVSTNEGLYCLPAHRKEAKLLTYSPYLENSLVGAKGTAAFSLDEQTVVLGTQSGLSLYDWRARTFKNIQLPTYNNNNLNNYITAITAAADGGFWVGTWSGLFHLDRTGSRIREYYITYINAGSDHPESVKRLQIGGIGALHLDEVRGILWISNKARELSKMDLNDPRRPVEIVKDMFPADEVHDSQVLCFLAYDDRTLLMGTTDGLVRFDHGDGAYHHLPIVFDPREKESYITSLWRSRNGDLLAIVNGRPYRIDVEQNRASPILATVDDQFFFKIIEDQQGSIWMTAESGLARTDGEGRNYVFFDAKNYLRDNTSQLGAEFEIAKDGNGRLYVGGSRGFSVIDPEVMAYNAAAPDVRITALKVNNLPLDDYASLYEKRAIVLPYRQNSFSLEFAALGSLIPALNRFAYRFDKGDWVDLGRESTVNLSNLQPGTYRLQVKAANSDGIWNEEGAYLSITIRPPWYRTWPAWLIYIGMLGYGIYYLYRYQLRRRLEQAETLRLKELDGFKSRFFTNITHEFRTPLTVILGLSTQSVEEKEVSIPTLKDRFRMISRNGENLLRLINQLLDLAQLNTNTLKLNYIQGDIVAYLNYVAESLYSFANTGNVRIQVQSDESRIIMDYEPEQLRQIVYNLLSNAVKFAPSGGKVVLRLTVDGQRSTGPSAEAPLPSPRGGETGPLQTSPEGGGFPLEETLSPPSTVNRLPSTVITVSDTGTGIPPEDLPYIFDRFFQSKNQDVVTTKGSGVGLALTKELVKAMGGDITVQSPTLPDGRGTTFVLTLPITNKAPFAQPGAMPAPAAGVGLERYEATAENTGDDAADRPLLLVIEDNPDVLDYITSCLQGEYQLDFAYNGRAGIEKAFEVMPDIILSDVMMPEKSGLDVLQTLKHDERTSHIPIVLLTAKASVEERVEGLSTGADAYLTKPFYPRELLVVLSKLLELRKTLQAKYAALAALPSTGAPLPSPRRGETDRPTGGDLQLPTSDFPLPTLEPSTDPEDAFLQKIRAVVEARLSDADFEMHHLERALGMSRSHIFRKVKALTGKSPTSFIRSIRLHHGRRLLTTTDLTVSEIAYDVGFTTVKYFSDAFVEEFGLRPTEARKQ